VFAVKETTKTAWYSSVILAGVGVTACILYYIFNELFSSDSANNVYAAALNRCLKEIKIIDLLGEPIKGFGEETRRGRRQHVRYTLV
jgi:import inner membrane translocase subunit TIM21